MAKQFWEAQYEKRFGENGTRKQARKSVASTSRMLLWLGVGFMSIVGGFSTAALLPGFLGLSGLFGLIAAGFVVDYIYYGDSFIKGNKILFATGISIDLELFLAEREATAWLKKNHKDPNQLKEAHPEFFQMVIKDFLRKNKLKRDDLSDRKQNIKLKKYFIRRLGKQLARKHLCYTQQNNDGRDSTDDKLKPLINEYHLEYQKNQAGLKKEHSQKLKLIKLATVFSLTTGLFWFCIAAVETFSWFGIAAITTATLPAVLPILAASLLVGYLQGLLFFKMLQGGIKKNIGSMLWNHIKYKPAKNNDGDDYGIFMSLPKNLLKWGLMLSVGALAITGITLTLGTYMESTFELLTMVFGGVNGRLDLTIQALMYTVVLPVNALFTVRHTLGACEKLTNAVTNGISWFVSSSPSEWFENPGKTLLFGTAFVIAFGALAVHAVAEAAMTVVNKGEIPISTLPGKIFLTLCEWVGAEPALAAAGVATVKEVVEHAHVTCQQSENLLRWVKPPAVDFDQRKNVGDYANFRPDDLDKDPDAPIAVNFS